MNHKEIEYLLLKYREGRCTPEEVALVHTWYEHIDSGISQEELTNEEKWLLRNKMLTAIDHQRNPQEGRIVPGFSWISVRMMSSIAAMFIVALSLFFFLREKPSLKMADQTPLLLSESEEAVIHTDNSTAKPMLVKLEDNSKITLAPGASLAYPRFFSSDKREVQLKGDAFFDISKDSHRPFYVYSGRLVTRVLGTSFWVKGGGNKPQMEVEVVSGRVSVFENESFERRQVVAGSKHKFNKGVILTPNQRVTYFEESGHLMTSLVDKPILLTIENEPIPSIYKNVPLSKIFNSLEMAYGVEILLSTDGENECTFTGDLTQMSLFEQLELICQSNDGTYEVQGTSILVSTNGCK